MASIRKRGNKFQVQVRRKEQGSLSRSFHNREDAKRWARNMEVLADNWELPCTKKSLEQHILGDLVVRYVQSVTPSKKSASYETIILNAFIEHPICLLKLSRLTHQDFAKYRDERLKVIKPASLKRQLNPIRHMFEVARHEWGIPIRENPLAKLKFKATDNRRERRLKDGEFERLYKAGQNLKNPFVIPVILFALETAMRRGEILSLCRDQIDFKRSSATILESKNGYSRTIPLSPKAIDILVSCKGEGTRCFPISANAIRLAWQRLCKKADVTDLHFHDLRHEAISRFFEIGLTVPEVASISGHRDIRILSRYAHSRSELILKKLAN